jgi:serpin B
MHPFPLNRRKFLTLSGAAALGSLTPALARACPNLDAPDPMKLQQDAATAINAFGADLYRKLAGRDAREKGTLFLSPFSLETALAMTSAGARGKTLEEMEKVLHLPADPHAGFGALIDRLNGSVFALPKRPPTTAELVPHRSIDAERAPHGSIDPVPIEVGRSYELSIANAIWAQKGFPWEKAFLELVRKHYGAGTSEVDFAESETARKQINAWVEKETREKIKDLIEPGILSRLTRMVLANAIYFKSNWQYQFDKKLTKDAPFTHADGTKADVPLMALTGKLNYGETWIGGRAGVAAQVLELPYTGKELSMLVVLPDTASGIHRLAELLTPGWLGRVETKPTEVNVFLPRFKAESTLSLKPVLMDMGMKAAFGAADFTGMSPQGKQLFMAQVLHKAFVDVNEEGTEAAAATAVIINKIVSAPPEQKVFRADRPFVFAIRDNATGAALFLGRYSGPKA